MVDKQFIDFPISHLTRYGQNEVLALPLERIRKPLSFRFSKNGRPSPNHDQPTAFLCQPAHPVRAGQAAKSSLLRPNLIDAHRHWLPMRPGSRVRIAADGVTVAAYAAPAESRQPAMRRFV